MNSFHNENLISACQNGSVEEAKKSISNGANVDYQDQDGNNGLHYAAMNGKVEVLRYLVNNSIPLDALNNEGKTALHLACEKGDKESIFFLVTNGASVEIKNKSGQKPGEGNMDAKMLLNNIVCEEKAFNILPPAQKAKILEIFYDVDFDGQKQIDLSKSKRFNKYIDEQINDGGIEKDAKDFIKACAICNKETVNIDEWIFAFSKLYAVDQAAFDKFVDDYDKAVEKKGKLKNLEFEQ
ncbi:hypothetical protein ABPG72_011330 [Tetrahymena utriculariae]